MAPLTGRGHRKRMEYNVAGKGFFWMLGENIWQKQEVPERHEKYLIWKYSFSSSPLKDLVSLGTYLVW